MVIRIRAMDRESRYPYASVITPLDIAHDLAATFPLAYKPYIYFSPYLKALIISY